MPRYVILEHDHPFLHWDFMLEAGDVLRTWRLGAAPQVGTTIRAEPLGDHRKQYLDYEGPVSGGRGSVKRWDAGTIVWHVDGCDRVVVALRGHRLSGSGALERDASGRWSFLLTH
ncbi:MAG: hypothetical protein K2R98_22035 [Gemmataceae bacterium]|nr:hypothetical protein [Gemmataceae bacterium]